MSIFAVVADQRERAARIRAILYPHMAADILAANARVEGELCCMHYNQMAREQGYGCPRFASVVEMRAYYDAPFVCKVMPGDLDGDPIASEQYWADRWDE